MSYTIHEILRRDSGTLLLLEGRERRGEGRRAWERKKGEDEEGRREKGVVGV